MDNSDLGKTKEKVKRELADFLGVSMEDIEDETTLTEDLHMKASDLTDFMEILNVAGFDTSKIDLMEVETFSELVEALTDHQ